MILKNGDQFVEALKWQRQARETEDTAKGKYAKIRARKEYANVTKSIEEYVRNMNKFGERDDNRD